ncbi:mannosyltransferase [Epithele typhae]|uniref:mannosyltransferase n=1 Tax=Epithele typhae TaxID=378194 RepID=UPI002007761E|nr:mannosyltransferase [Epithele typhae]KAH9911684.1 mannosyltransferase [Epithele typhae]
MASKKLKIAFVHPDLGIGGAERLIVDAALGLQKLGHSVDIYTSHHDPGHCFEETRDGTLRVHYVVPPFPRAIQGKLHIVFAHARQLHLTLHLLAPGAPKYDVYFVDQLSTCVPLLRTFGRTRVLFYCHFPDKLLADGAYVEGRTRPRGSLLKRIYRLPMDFVEETTTKQADTILANSRFTAGVFRRHMPSIRVTPRVVYPGINIEMYKPPKISQNDPTWLKPCRTDRPTLLSLNRFEAKKNAALAIEAFAQLRKQIAQSSRSALIVSPGGYDPRLKDNVDTLESLLSLTTSHVLTYVVVTPSTSSVPLPTLPALSTAATNGSANVLFLLNFSSAQRSALLTAPSTLVLLYTPANEHFGIVPSVVESPESEKTGWLRRPEPSVWAETLSAVISLPQAERVRLAENARRRARARFGMEAMARDMEAALLDTVALGPVGTPAWVWAMVAALLGVVAVLVQMLL